jgi:hypothetical protein
VSIDEIYWPFSNVYEIYVRTIHRYNTCHVVHYFFDDLPSRRSRLDERFERFLSRSLAVRCEFERWADNSLDDDELDERFLNE